MRGSGSRLREEDVRASADLIASVVLLGIVLMLSFAGSMVIWLEAGWLSANEPTFPPSCTFEQEVVVAALVLSLAVFLGAAGVVAYRRRSGLTGSPVAAIAIGGVALVFAIAGWIAYVNAPTMCLH